MASWPYPFATKARVWIRPRRCRQCPNFDEIVVSRQGGPTGERGDGERRERFLS